LIIEFVASHEETEKKDEPDEVAALEFEPEDDDVKLVEV